MYTRPSTSWTRAPSARATTTGGVAMPRDVALARRDHALRLRPLLDGQGAIFARSPERTYVFLVESHP